MKAIVCALSVWLFLSACNDATNSTEKQADSLSANSETAATTSQANTDSLQADPSLVPASSLQTAAVVKQSLQEMFKDDLSKGIIDSFSRKFAFYEYDLNNDGPKEILVATRGTYFCGSGGCTIFLLDQKGKLLNRFTVSDYPVVISSNKTNGWNDLLIPSKGKTHLVKYNGKAYPGNPSILPEYTGAISDAEPHALNTQNQLYPWFEF